MSHAGGELAEQAGRLAAQAEKVALCLDFDGTLSPIVPDPEAARPLEGMVELLGQLAARYAAVALISGRPADSWARSWAHRSPPWPQPRPPRRCRSAYGLASSAARRLATWALGVSRPGWEVSLGVRLPCAVAIPARSGRWPAR
jgi:Trehalose-phosphatase